MSEEGKREAQTLLEKLRDLGCATRREKDAVGLLGAAADGQKPYCLLDQFPVGLICCDRTAERNFFHCSAGFLALHGYSRQEVSEQFNDQLSRIIHTKDRVSSWNMIQEQLTCGDTWEVEYSLHCKGNKLIWVLDRGHVVRLADGTEFCCCVLTDETRAKADRDALRMSLERHQMIMDQTDDIIFEWDVETDQFHFSDKWEKKLGYSPRTQHVTEWLAESAHIHPEDRKIIRQMIRKALGNETYFEGEFRLADLDGRYLWCRSRITLQRDEHGAPKKAVGIICDINAEKQETQKLMNMAERDMLTGLYNKGTTQRLVEQHLQNLQNLHGSRSALLIIDMDNFKMVNDTYGHLSGDTLLSEAASALQGLFRKGDVVGRIGGDEFCVLICGIPNRIVAERKASQILSLFRNLMEERSENLLTTSIGIAMAPEDGGDFPTLFQNADIALYQAKQQGKDQYVFYSSGMELPERYPERLATRQQLELEAAKFFSIELARHVFQVMYEVSDVEKALRLALEVVGRRLDVSRVYLYHCSTDGSQANVVAEWHGGGAAAKRQVCAALSMEVRLAALREAGIFYSHDVTQLPQSMRDSLETQGVRAVLECALWDGNLLWGALGFYECKTARLWTREQMDSLSFISKIISVFLISRGAQPCAEESLGTPGGREGQKGGEV